MTIRLALTPGEPSGVGPDLLIQLAQKQHQAELIAFADADLLAQRAAQLELPLQIKSFAPDQPPQPSQAGVLSVASISVAQPVVAGTLNQANAHYVLNTLDQAVHACQTGLCDAMVTGPVQKSVINQAGISFSGHTEYLAAKTNTSTVVMMLATEELRVALATTHLPLREVAQTIDRQLLTDVIEVLCHDLENVFGIK